MGRTENVEFFEHTRKLCQTNATLVAAIRTSNQAQKIFLETDNITKIGPRYETPAKIIVSNKRSLEAAQA